MNKANFVRWIGLSGIAGVLILITSFIINPGPGPNPSLEEFINFGKTHYYAIMIGGWTQAVSPPLIVIFALGVVHISGASHRFSGILTFFAGILLIIVSMVEITFYFSAVTGKPSTTGLISMDLISSVQRLYSIVAAPFLFFAFSLIIVRGRVVPQVLGYIGFLLGSVFFILGILQLFYPIQYIVNYFSIGQGFWWLNCAVIVFVNAGKIGRIDGLG